MSNLPPEVIAMVRELPECCFQALRDVLEVMLKAKINLDTFR